ncbi:RNA polymerase sigma factor [Mycolicibacterium stellerae]|uniref:RNA polymerase sigma factor n=1 Tax=Mycolicibacterium stellerae TaxID=2358193 RepID=UPI0019D1731A|nr:sigma-70 family RNA polymerase sigma factor [Mycolicibacterium stellerae]
MTAVPHWDIVGPAETDADLARAAAAGDRVAFAGIYDRYADRLHDFCVGMLRDRDDAADCVQDAFCTAASRLGQLRDADKLRPWLYAIARNEALRRLRDRRRETLSDELPETVSDEPGPETLAARTELADLISDAAGGLSDRDRSILELTYRHGLDGPDLAEALCVSPANATKMVQRLRDTVERSLGALLVARRIRNTGAGCPELTAILDGWDGHFTVLMRKRIARHIESCAICHNDRQRLVSPVALLGATPAFIPAPAALRERTLDGIRLAPSTGPIEAEVAEPVADSPAAGPTAPIPVGPVGPVEPVARQPGKRTRRGLLAIGLLAAVVAASLGLAITWQQHKNVNIAPADIKETASQAVNTTPSETASQTPSSPIPSPPTATTSLSVPPVAELPSATATSEAPPPREVAPEPPAFQEPTPAQPPEPGVPDPRTPADLPNDAIAPRDQRAQPPARIAGVPPSPAAEQPNRRAINPPPSKPTQRRVIRSVPGLNSEPDPPR